MVQHYLKTLSLYPWYEFHVNFMYLLQCLKVFLTDSFRLRDEVQRSPAVHSRKAIIFSYFAA